MTPERLDELKKLTAEATESTSRTAMAELINEVEYLKRTIKSMEHPSHEAYWRNEVQRG